MNLSPHFSLDELIVSQSAARHGIDNNPPPAAIENLKRLCVLLENVRELFGKPLRISSGYRSPKVNALIGGSEKSQHCQGAACDFTIQGVTIDQVMDSITVNGLPYDQVIKEFGAWIHISVPTCPWDNPRKMELIIDKNGTRPYSIGQK